MDAPRFAMLLPEFWRICTRETLGSVSPRDESVAGVLAVLPQKFRPLFLAAEAMVVSPRGSTQGYEDVWAYGAIPVLRNPIDGLYRRIHDPKDPAILKHCMRLTSELVAEEMAREAVVLSRMRDLDDSDRNLIGFRLRGMKSDESFKLRIIGDPGKNAGVVIDLCRGYCYQKGLWLIEPSDMRKILIELGTSSAGEMPKPPQTFAEIHNNKRVREKAAGKQPAPKKPKRPRR